MTLTREGDGSAGAVGRFAVDALYHGLVVTAVEDGSGNLKVITWMVSQDGKGTEAGGKYVKRVADASGGAVGRVAVSAAQITANGETFCRIVTAVRTGGELKLIGWKCDLDGKNLVRKGEAHAGTVSELALASLSDSQVLTAVRNGSGDLEIIVWSVSPDGSAISRGASKNAGAVTRVTAVATGPFSPSIEGSWIGAVTAVETDGGNLKLIGWGVAPDGSAIERRGEGGAGAIGEVAAVKSSSFSDSGFTNPREGIVTVVRNGSGNLELINWLVSDTTSNQVTRVATLLGGAISHVAAGTIGTPFETNRIVAAGRDAAGKLAVSLYDANDTTLTPAEIASAGEIDAVAVTWTWAYELVTAVKNGAGNLELIAWRHG